MIAIPNPKILVVSDVHYDNKIHHNIYEGDQKDFLFSIIDNHKPDSLIGCGDFGYSWTYDDWQELTKKINCNIIYGNHDVLYVQNLTEYRPKNTNNINVVPDDGEKRNLFGLNFGFINGIISTRKWKGGVRRKTLEEYMDIANKLNNIDVLITHESPLLPEYTFLRPPMTGVKALTEIIEKIQPKISFSGHISGPYSTGFFGRTLNVRVDTSAKEKHYAIFYPYKLIIEIYNNQNLVKKIDYAQIINENFK